MSPRAVGAAIAAAGLIFGAVVYVGWLRPGDSESAESILARSAAAMSRVAFSHRQDCVNCDTPTLAEYAPPGDIKISNALGGDSWTYYLLLDGAGYFSSDGLRWMTGDHAALATLGLTDPRRMAT